MLFADSQMDWPEAFAFAAFCAAGVAAVWIGAGCPWPRRDEE